MERLKVRQKNLQSKKMMPWQVLKNFLINMKRQMLSKIDNLDGQTRNRKGLNQSF